MYYIYYNIYLKLIIYIFYLLKDQNENKIKYK